MQRIQMNNPREMDRIEMLEAELARCQQECNASKQRQALFQLFRDNVEDFAFVSFDLGNRIIGWSRGAELILGYSEQEILGESGSVFFTPEDVSAGQVERELLVAQAEGRAEEERWHVRKDGSRFWGSGVMVSLRDASGQQQGFGKVFRDFTERKEMEDRLTASAREKELILRVKNNLQVITSLISLQARLNAPPAMKPHFDELEGRVRAIAGLHETLYSSPDLGSILFGAYMERLLQHLWSFHRVDPQRLSFQVQAADVVLKVEQALPLGLIINELVTNALKHAFPGEKRGVVSVSLCYLPIATGQSLDDAYCELSIRDNGIGFAGGQDIQKPKSMGLHIVELLVSELGGTLHVDIEPKAGANFRVRFPLEEDRLSEHPRPLTGGIDLGRSDP
jgi:PAS domain S-box-containing protein